jgi:hypothetical protein
MPSAGESKRIFFRKEQAEFTVSFFADNSATPLVPLDAGIYPSYTIYDPQNQVIQSGVANQYGNPGKYRVLFIVPEDSLLSNDLQRWRIEWIFVSEDNRQLEYAEEFDVHDTVITASESREQKFITIAGQDYRVFLRQSFEPAEVALDMFNSSYITPVLSASTDINKVVDGDSIVYYYDIPGSKLGLNNAYNVLWKIRPTVTEPFQFISQQVGAIHPSILALVSSLRMLIDKLQKRLGTAMAYEDSDLVEYLARGHELVNAVYPVSGYQFGLLPGVLATHHILLSGWYALQAQGLLNVELGISFSGQSVTFDYDQAGGLADLAGRWQDYVNNGLSSTKIALMRASTPAAINAGRGVRYNSIQNFVYKIGSTTGSSQDIIGQLVRTGLLW